MLGFLEYFGTITIAPVKNQSVFTGINLTREYADAQITMGLDRILCSGHMSEQGEQGEPVEQVEQIPVSMLLIDNAIRHFCKSTADIEHIVSRVYLTATKYLASYHSVLQNADDKWHTFKKIRQAYMERFAMLGTVFAPLADVYVVAGRNQYKSDMFKLIRDYVFYEQMLMFGSTHDPATNLVERLVELMASDTYTCEHIIELFKVVNMYKGFSYSVTCKNKRHEIFAPRLDWIDFTRIMTITRVREIVTHADQLIRSMVTMGHADPIKKKQSIDRVTDLIYVSQRIANPAVWMSVYHEYLQSRLLERHTMDMDMDVNIDVEESLVGLIDHRLAPVQYTKICSAINCIKSSRLINKEFRQIPVRFDTADYSEEFQRTFDRTATQFTVLRGSVWDRDWMHPSVQCHGIQIPDILSGYLRMFKTFYEKHIAPSKRLTYMYGGSTVELDLTLGGKKYVVRMGLVRAIILIEIVGANGITCEQLYERTRVPINMIYEHTMVMCGRLTAINPFSAIVLASIDTEHVSYRANNRFVCENDFIDLTQDNPTDPANQVNVADPVNQVNQVNVADPVNLADPVNVADPVDPVNVSHDETPDDSAISDDLDVDDEEIQYKAQ